MKRLILKSYINYFVKWESDARIYLSDDCIYFSDVCSYLTDDRSFLLCLFLDLKQNLNIAL